MIANSHGKIAGWTDYDEREIQQLERWLLTRGLGICPIDEVLEGLGKHLVALGFPLIRLAASMNTRHPMYRGFGYVWQAGEGAVQQDALLRLSAGGEENPDFAGSPFDYILSKRLNRFRQRLDGPADPEFDIYRSFRAAGATDYVVETVSFTELQIGDVPLDLEEEQGMAFSWVGNRPGGWTDGDLELIHRLVPAFSLVVKARVTEMTMDSLAQTYLGRDAGRRVVDGAVDRGSVETIHAAIFFADLRGFTALADRLPGPEVITLLDDYFELITQPIVHNGGEVLKFLGDGLLAVFEVGQKECCELCQQALDAARRALVGIADYNRTRRGNGLPGLDLDIALHVGDVLYGNVGAVGRLDFTIVGPAVNEASRMEGLCKPLDQNLLISDEFARQATLCADKLVSVGEYDLRDLPGKRRIFTVRPEIWRDWFEVGDGISGA